MVSRNLDNMTDKELYDKIHQAGLAERLANSEEWQLVQKAADRIVERAVRTLVNTPATNMAAVIELQQVIKKYKFGLFAEIEMLRKEGELIFDELKEREALPDFTSDIGESVHGT